MSRFTARFGRHAEALRPRRGAAWIVAGLVAWSVVSAGCGSGEPRGRSERAPRTEPSETATLGEPQAGPTQEADTQEAPPAPTPGRTLALRLDTRSHPVPEGAAHAMVCIPPGFDASAPWTLVVFLHGWNGCAPVLMERGETPCIPGAPPEPGWDLRGAFEDAGINAIFVIPQLAFRKRSGRAGRFTEPGRARAFVEELAAKVDGWPPSPPSRRTLVAHSAGFETALAWLRHGQLAIDEVVLMDALYAGTDRFARWAADDAGRRLISIHTGRGSTARQSRRLRGLARRSELSLGDALTDDAQVVVFETSAPHRDVPARHLAEALAAEALAAETIGTEIQ